MSYYKYVITGCPIPLKRPRFAKQTGRVFDPQIFVKARCVNEIMLQHNNRPLLAGPLHVEVTFYMPIPSSCSNKTRESLMGSFHHKMPDFSNMLKFIEDVCTGIVYEDDRLICSINGCKLYDLVPRTEISFMEVPDEIPS
jgi:Holliday junction resolvase RusA-like endonuclease